LRFQPVVRPECADRAGVTATAADMDFACHPIQTIIAASSKAITAPPRWNFLIID
jgi:hypothetical protein